MDPPQQQPWGDAAAGSAISSDPHAATSQDDANAPAVPGPAEPGPPAPVVDNVDMAVAEEGLVVEEVDSEEVDSAVDVSSFLSSTMSVSSSVAVKLEENGRTYHTYKEGKYMLPNDEAELGRLDIQHKMWEITLDGKLHKAPIGTSPQRVLDIGTGKGNWAIEFATAYPSAIVIGTDLSPVQPQYVPVNCEFQIDDAEDDWVFSQPFDYIHGRALATCFKDPLSIFRKAYAALRPGGWFEMQDVVLQESEDGSIRGTSLEEIQHRIAEATAASGRLWSNVPKYPGWMVEAGFEDVQVEKYRWPSNPSWPTDPKERTLGAWMLAQSETAGLLESVCTRLFMTKLGWSRERLDEFVAIAKRDLRDPNLRVYSPVLAVYGRKPIRPGDVTAGADDVSVAST